MLRDESTPSFYGSHIYERVIPKDHFLKLLGEAVDFSFVNELCRDAYTPDFGRPAYEPEMMFKILFLQFLYDVSDRRIEEEVNQFAFKWFVGLTIDEAPPCPFPGRLGEERFAQIFNQIPSNTKLMPVWTTEVDSSPGWRPLRVMPMMARNSPGW